MWFGIENGVSVYDRIRVHSYKPFQKISGDFFEGVFVSQIVCNQSGDVFFATPQELVKYDVRQDCFLGEILFILFRSTNCMSIILKQEKRNIRRLFL